jgi:carotenoid cleavage dioxygenase-like enzyme
MKNEMIKDYEQQDTPAWTSDEEHFHNVNPYLHGALGPIKFEHTEDELVVLEGKVPDDLTGVYVRNGANSRFASKGPHHWFDGDGMLHALSFKDGKASYRNRWIRTKHFNMESEAQKVLWPGYAMPRPDPNSPRGSGSDFSIKDGSNTDVVWHNGALLTTFYQTGIPYRVNPVTLETEGQETFNSKLPRQMSAHCKVDDSTGELMFFDYNMEEPYLTYGVVDKNGLLTDYVEVPLPGARLPHDMAITENYSILMDLPLYWNEGRHGLHYFKDRPSRFAVIPRHGKQKDIQWFDASACYMYHTVNAYEEDGKIIMDGCRQPDPIMPRQPGDGVVERMKSAGTWNNVKLYRWTFNLTTGETTEEQLDDTNVEFPMINADWVLGKKYRYSYSTLMPTDAMINYSGIFKFNHVTREKEIYEFPAGSCGSETPFAPADNAKNEDDGYLISFLTDNETGNSEAVIFDARKISAGPVCRLKIPERVPVGFHACWVSSDKAVGL